MRGIGEDETGKPVSRRVVSTLAFVELGTTGAEAAPPRDERDEPDTPGPHGVHPIAASTPPFLAAIPAAYTFSSPE